MSRSTIERRAREAQGHLVYLEAHAGEIAAWLARMADSGVSGISYDGTRPPPGHSDPTAARALRRSNAAHDQWTRRFHKAVSEITELRRMALDFRALPADVAQASLRTDRRAAGAGECKHCGRVVLGRATLPDGSKVDDRLRGGRCDACRQAWERSGRTQERVLDCGHGCCLERSVAGHTHLVDAAGCRACLSMEAGAA